MGLHQQQLLQRQPELSYRDLYYPGSHRYAASTGAGVTHVNHAQHVTPLKNDVHLYKAVKPQRHPDVIEYVGGKIGGAVQPLQRDQDHPTERGVLRRITGQHRRVIRYRGVGQKEDADHADEGHLQRRRRRRSLSRSPRSYVPASELGSGGSVGGAEAGIPAEATMLEPAGVALIAAVHQKSFNSVAHRPVAHGVEDTLYYAIVNVEQHGLYMTQVPGFPKRYF